MTLINIQFGYNVLTARNKRETGREKNGKMCKISGENWFLNTNFVHKFAVKCGEIK